MRQEKYQTVALHAGMRIEDDILTLSTFHNAVERRIVRRLLKGWESDIPLYLWTPAASGHRVYRVQEVAVDSTKTIEVRVRLSRLKVFGNGDEIRDQSIEHLREYLRLGLLCPWQIEAVKVYVDMYEAHKNFAQVSATPKGGHIGSV